MNDEHLDPYTWDRSGPPNAYVCRLETLLGPYRFDGSIAAGTHSVRSWRVWYAAAALAAAALVVFAAWVALIPILGQPGREWRVVALAGLPRVSGAPVRDAAALAPGGAVQTDASSRAEIRAGRVGRIEVEPGSQVRLLSTESGRHRLAVDRGRIRARLWSPPFTFGFSTPSADAFDVGCAFVMDVDSRGAATVRVSSGWVQIEAQNGQQLIPQGMLANTEPNHAVGTAHFESATEAFQNALHGFDFRRLSASERRDALTTLLREARRDDVFTLLQLAQRLTPSERGELYDRATQLRPPPNRVTRATIVAGEGGALEAWRRTLGFPEVKRWWLHWTDAFAF